MTVQVCHSIPYTTTLSFLHHDLQMETLDGETLIKILKNVLVGSGEVVVLSYTFEHLLQLRTQILLCGNRYGALLGYW